MRYAAARNAAYTFPSPLYVSLITSCVDSRVCTNRDGIGGLKFCRCGYISVPSFFVRLNSSRTISCSSNDVGGVTFTYVGPRVAIASLRGALRGSTACVAEGSIRWHTREVQLAEAHELAVRFLVVAGKELGAQ